MAGSEFIEMFVGVGASRVRDLFAQARDKAPSIIFIDEIDAVGRWRGGSGGNDERNSTLNALLTEMDGFSPSTGVVVLAGTNRADTLDAALKRAGRFDRHIAIERPDLQDRQKMFKLHLKPIKTIEHLDKSEIARRMASLTPGFSGADVKNICNEAAITAARREWDYVEMVDFEVAAERVMAGLTKVTNMMTAQEKRTIAIHESGHAVAGWFLPKAEPLLKVSIVPRANGWLGFAQYLPSEVGLYGKQMLLDRMAVTLGGRAAEDAFIGSITTGASDDLKKVTQTAYNMVGSWGMSEKVGLFNYSKEGGGLQHRQYSEEKQELIDDVTKEIIDGQYSRVKELLKEKQELVMALTDRLMEKETVLYKDLVEILGPRPVPLGAEMEKYVMATARTMADAEADGKILKPGAGAGTGSSSEGPGGMDGGEKVIEEPPMGVPAAASKEDDSILKSQGWVLK